jgi:hypothetical protein
VLSEEERRQKVSDLVIYDPGLAWLSIQEENGKI